jgi:multisubunit Na+/H+ antiporter MnhB subunit
MHSFKGAVLLIVGLAFLVLAVTAFPTPPRKGSLSKVSGKDGLAFLNEWNTNKESYFRLFFLFSFSCSCCCSCNIKKDDI